jgi:hypothetical protein
LQIVYFTDINGKLLLLGGPWFSLIKGYSLSLCAEEPVDAYMGELAFEPQKGISMLWPPQGLPPRAGAGEI